MDSSLLLSCPFSSVLWIFRNSSCRQICLGDFHLCCSKGQKSSFQVFCAGESFTCLLWQNFCRRAGTAWEQQFNTVSAVIPSITCTIRGIQRSWTISGQDLSFWGLCCSLLCCVESVCALPFSMGAVPVLFCLQ